MIRESLAVLVALGLLLPGCGQGPEFDKATQYTPESLAQELAFRYNALSPEGKTPKRARRPGKKAVDSKADEQSSTKSQSKTAAKKGLARTIDDVLDEIEAKADLVKGKTRAEVFKAMAEGLAGDKSLKDDERQALVGKLRELSGG